MNIYKRHRFPPDIISYAVWLYYRFNLSHVRHPGGSSQSGRLSDFWVYMLLVTIYSIWVGISYPPTTTGISGIVRSVNGVGQLLEIMW
jgi:hypothetical protein